ncbi:MAG TPA: diacylglycerol kinase family protein [Acidimicrobiales bacterium]|jgi:diacylglycerol kinase (ATP)|nr:diacylglycerol kinase family protein [Acidimicrobiales bacterium]
MIVHLLGNPTADGGRAGATIDAVAARVRAHGHDLVRHDAPSVAAVTDAAARAVRDQVDRLLLVGGDGLIHLAAQAAACSATPIGIVPAGSGNDFAGALGLDRGTTADAVDRALAPAHPMDAIRVGDRWVVSVATLGFSARVNQRANALRRPRGPARYTVATLLELPRLAPVALTIELDGVRHDWEITLLAIANTAAFGGGMAICPNASPHDGQLEIAVIGPVGRATLLRIFPRVFKGTHVTHPAVRMFSARRVVVHSGAQPVRGDGEPVGATPITFEAVPGALMVAGIAPPGEAV